MSLLIIGLFIILIIILILLNKRKEHVTNDEAIQNIASVYNNSSNLIVTNLTVTGELKANNFKGMIVAYSGDVSGIPVGWALCDGTNGTPDLRGRFILNYNPIAKTDSSNNIILSKRIIGTTGGSEIETLTRDNLPKHNHYIASDWKMESDNSDPFKDLSVVKWSPDMTYKIKDSSDNEIKHIYIRYDDVNMKYVYLCYECETVWKINEKS